MLDLRALAPMQRHVELRNGHAITNPYRYRIEVFYFTSIRFAQVSSIPLEQLLILPELSSLACNITNTEHDWSLSTFIWLFHSSAACHIRHDTVEYQYGRREREKDDSLSGTAYTVNRHQFQVV